MQRADGGWGYHDASEGADLDGGEEIGSVDSGHGVTYSDIPPVDLVLGELALQLKKGMWSVREGAGAPLHQ